MTDLAFDDRAIYGRRILYWAVSENRGIFALADVFTSLFLATEPLRRPQDCVNTRVMLRKRQVVAKLLAAGAPVESYYGHATCRICGVELGNKDLYGYGFIWPEKAEHYILEHEVWTPDCDRLFDAARRN